MNQVDHVSQNRTLMPMQMAYDLVELLFLTKTLIETHPDSTFKQNCGKVYNDTYLKWEPNINFLLQPKNEGPIN